MRGWESAWGTVNSEKAKIGYSSGDKAVADILLFCFGVEDDKEKLRCWRKDLDSVTSLYNDRKA